MRLVTRNEAAEALRIPPAKVSENIDSGVWPDTVLVGNKVNLDHEFFTGKEDDLTPPNLVEVADYTLREIFNKFGSNTAFMEQLDAYKTVETIREKQLKNAEAEGKIIGRDFVAKHIIALIDDIYTKLLTDVPVTIAATTQKCVKAGLSDEEVIQEIKEVLGTVIKGTKEKAKKRLVSC